MGIVRRQEWKWVLVVAGLIVAVSTVPYLAGYLAQNAEWQFCGALVNQGDYHTYLAKMWQGARGAWQYRVPFTTESHEGAYLVTFHIALGHLARVLGLDLPLVYQLARILFGFLMLLAIYRFVALFVHLVRTRRVAFLLATVASGLGWLTELAAPTPPAGVSPMDFWLSDAYTYPALLVAPHFSAAISLLLVTYILLLRRPAGPSVLDGELAILSSFALGIIHPFTLLLADLVPLLWYGVGWLRSRHLNGPGVIVVAAMGLTQVPLLVYDLWVFRIPPVFSAWAGQNVTLSPPLRVYLWGYGALLVLGAAGTVAWARRGWPGLAFPLIWIGLVALLTQLPWNVQRRFLEGVQIPLGLLAGVGLAEGLFSVPQQEQPGGRGSGIRWRWLAMAMLLALVAMSNLYLTTAYTVAAATRSPALFWPANIVTAVDWLGANTTPEDTVLSSFEVGNLIPGRIGHRVVLGHGMETVDYDGKREDVAQFFTETTSDEARIALLERYGVAYVFFGPYERALGGFDPEEIDYLTLVFCSEGISIYRVHLDGR